MSGLPQEKYIPVYYLLYGKPSLRQIPELWLALSRSGFCSTDRFHGNGPTHVFLFWSEGGKFKICNQNSKKQKNCEYCHSPQWNYQKKLKRLNFFHNISKMDEEDKHSPSEVYYPEDLETFEVETETGITVCHITKNLLTELARAVLGNIGPRAWQCRPSFALG